MINFTLHSQHTNYTYTITCAIPEGPAPSEGFPIIYVLDGSSYTTLIAETVRLQSRNTLRTKVAASIVVGICHGEDMSDRRFLDFTAPADAYHYPARFNGTPNRPHGGAQNFATFIAEELKPVLFKKFAINRAQQTLYGHSLGGYFTLWHWLNEPQAFSNYLAISPSIWWNNHEIMSQLQTMKSNFTKPLYIAVGEHEDFMVTDAQQFYTVIKAQPLLSDFYCAVDENHASVVPATISRALRFTYNAFN